MLWPARVGAAQLQRRCEQCNAEVLRLCVGFGVCVRVDFERSGAARATKREKLDALERFSSLIFSKREKCYALERKFECENGALNLRGTYILHVIIYL